jgi:hypothetical protein
LNTRPKEKTTFIVALSYTQLYTLFMPRKKPKPKTATRPGQTLVAVWFPTDFAELLDKAAEQRDLNRSQLLRRAAKNFVS